MFPGKRLCFDNYGVLYIVVSVYYAVWEIYDYRPVILLRGDYYYDNATGQYSLSDSRFG